jgi:hypothetical protein
MAYINGKSGSFTLSNNNSGFTLRVNWSEQYDISTNTSIVSVDSMEMKSIYYDGMWWANLLIKVDDVTVAEMNYYNPPTHRVTIYPDGVYRKLEAYGTGVSAPWKSGPIEHNADGSKKINISIVPNPAGHKLTHIQIYRQTDDIVFRFDDKIASIDLTNIPRSSSLALSTYVVDAGDDVTVSIQRASSDFTHMVEFYINNTYYKKYTNVGTSQTYTIPIDWCKAMPSSTNCAAYCQITTYKGETQIGDPSRVSFTVNVPSSIVPNVGSIVLDPTDINNNNILVKGKNSLQITASDCSAGLGSSIKSYTFSGPSISKTVSSASSSASASISAVQTVGELTYSVKVTDTRGRIATGTAKITCYDYFSPSFSTFKAYRVGSDKQTPDANGPYLKCVYTPQYASVNSTNSVKVTVVYNDKTTENTLIDISSGGDKTYRVHLIITDAYGGSNVSRTITIFGQTRVFNITKDGTGVAVGKIAEHNNLFECRWPAQFNGNIKFGGNAQGTLEMNTSTGSNVAHLMCGQNTTSGAEAGLSVSGSAVYPRSSENTGILNLGTSARRWNQLYAVSDTIQTSDRNQKTDIKNMSDTQEQLFNKLKPVTYKLKKGSSGRTHYGFISQDIEEALIDLGLNGKDFAGFCKDARTDEGGETSYDYALRYAEFVALNTYMIKKLQDRIVELEETIKQMTS